MVQSFGQVPLMGILPSQPALLFHLIGEAVKASPFEGGKRAICRKGEVVSGLMLRSHRVFFCGLS
jgi:hypothetical protein